MAAEHHGIGTTIPEGPNDSFSDQQVHVFQTEDRAAAKSIIFLMSGVFTLGLIGSICVCTACWNG